MAYVDEDPAEFRENQRLAWDSVADGWRRRWSVLEKAAGAVNGRLVELAGIRPGMRVLDVGSGLGEPALTAARRVGPNGSVLATDLSARMLEHTKERAAEDGLAHLSVEVRDAEQLGLDGADFGAATSRWCLMLLADPRAAAQSILRALEPGARFAASVWGPVTSCPFFTAAQGVSAELFGAPAESPVGFAASPGPLRMAEAGMLEELLSRSGFEDVGSEFASATLEFESFAEFQVYLLDMSSKLRKALAKAPELETEFWTRLEVVLRPHVKDGGSIALTNTMYLAHGRRPTSGPAPEPEVKGP